MVIASGGWTQNASDSNKGKNMFAMGILICHDNSYPFHERTLSLEQPIKIGRSVARARAAIFNAIFDCKVLSRNHALLWYESGKFYLKDTKSSNGTFINNKRLSPSGEESVAYEVCSGDVVQFGVDVVESTKMVTHGCIVATLKLYLPGGKEAKSSLSNTVGYVNVALEDLYKLNQFIQEAGRRENAVRCKLEYMQQLLEYTRTSTNQSWKALVLEDCLLSRLQMLESQIVAYSKNYGEDKLRLELLNLLEDKAQYQSATKDLLQKKVQEKLEIINKVQILKCRLSETEEETQSLHNTITDNQNELQELAVKYIKIQQTLQDTTDKLNKTKSKLKEVMEQSEKEKQELLKKLEDQKSIERNLEISLKDSKLDSVYNYKQMTALKNYVQSLQDIKYEADNDSKNQANFFDTINIILSKWNSLHVEIVDKELEFNEDDQENHINLNGNNIKYRKSFFDNDSFSKEHIISNISTLESNRYILPPVSSKTCLIANHAFDSKNLNSEFFSKKSIDCTHDNCLKLKKVNESITLLNIDDNIKMEEKENIASVKLIMSFSNNKNNDNFNQKVILNNNFKSDIDYLYTETSLSSCISDQILKVAQQINKIIEMNKNLYAKQNLSKVKQIHLHNNYVINTLKSPLKNNFSFQKYSEDFILQNVVHLSDLNRSANSKNYNISTEELQELKTWLLCEPNEVIINKLKEYYFQFNNETQQIQELYEQLVILKEKYNKSIEEKADINKKFMTLEAQCKDFINTTYMVPIYYFAPIMFAMIWMLLEKIL